MKVPEGMFIDELLCGLNQSLNDNPPAWLAKNMKAKDASRFDDMASEGWSE
jgi:hypothetical protein